MASPTQIRALVLMSAIAAVATACGPISIDVGPLPSTKPSGGGTASTGPSAVPSPGTTTYPSVKPTSRPSPTPGSTVGPNETPRPTDTSDPNATPSPGASASPTPSPVPTGSATPVAWPSAEEIPGEPVQGKAYEIKRDAGKPMDVAVDKAGVAWVAIGNRITGSSDAATYKGEIITLASDGKPLKVYTVDGNPERIEAAKDGGVWVLMDVKGSSGSGNTMGLVRLGPDGKLLSRVDLSGNGGVSSAEQAVMVPDNAGNIWVKPAGYGNMTVHRVGAGGGLLGTYYQNATSGGGGYGATGLGVDNENRALLVDNGGKSVIRVGTNLQKDTSFPASLDNYGPIHVQGSGDKIWVGFTTELQIWKADGSKVSSTKTGFPINDIVTDGGGGIWALGISGGYQSYSGSVVHYDSDGVAQASYAVGPDPRGFGVGGDGSIWAANYQAGTVTRVGTR